MKKIFIPLIAVLISGCSIGSDTLDVDLPLEDRESEVVDEVVLEEDQVIDGEEGLRDFQISVPSYNLDLLVTLPDTVVDITNISSTSFRFVNSDGFETPTIFRINFYDDDLIEEIINYCEMDFGPCHPVDISDRDISRNIKYAIKNKDNSVYDIHEYNGFTFVVINHEPAEEIYISRQYTTFIEDVRVDILIAIESESQVEQADNLFNRLRIINK